MLTTNRTLPAEEIPRSESLPTFGRDGRYQTLRRLGEGGFGTVYEARDLRYGEVVAIKALRARSPSALFRFKREFRSLADLAHPNLVRLYELDAEGGFFVMQRVEGVHLSEHLAGGAAVTLETAAPGEAEPRSRGRHPRATDFARVREAFAQLADGLHALHAGQLLHCDVKPSNVMVDRDGRVVLLDFGLLLDDDRGSDALLGVGAGTPGYMSPEQRAGASLGPPSDWYAVGATLFDVLFGEPPSADADSLLATASDLPADLAALCRGLLDPSPERRPSGEAVLATLGRSRIDAAAGGAFVGREAALAALDTALADCASAPQVVRVVGAAGVGKSALLGAWRRIVERARPDVWILRGRCFEHEHTPYKALDGVVDALVARALELSVPVRGAMLDPAPRGAAALRRMFPLLQELEPFASAADEGASDDAKLQQERALGALGVCLGRITARAPVVMIVDDVHWGDGDSARALATLLGAGVKNLLLVLSQRPATAPDGFPAELATWLEHATRVRVTDVCLEALDPAAAAELTRRNLGARANERLVADIVAGAAGVPLLIEQLARAADGHDFSARGATLSGLVAARVARAPESVRRVVEVLAVASRPVSEDVLRHAAGLHDREVRPTLLSAAQSRLMTDQWVDGRHHVEAGHARLRDEVVRALTPGSLRALHLALSNALEACGEGSPEAVLPHLLGAGETARAEVAARSAAEHAEHVFAFDRAAELYAVLLDLEGARGDAAGLHARRAEALANAGRSAEAAASFEDAMAARPTVDPTTQTLRRRSAELWLRSGHVSRGLRGFREVLAPQGVRLPASDPEARRLSMWRRLRLLLRGTRFEARATGDIDPARLARLDDLWSATTSLAMLRFVIADALALQHLLEALEVGEPTRLLRALTFEAALEALLGGPLFDRRCRTMLREISRLAERDPSAYSRAWFTMSQGVVGWLQGDWAAAWTCCRKAAEVYAEQGRNLVWEQAVCDVYSLSAATYLGRIADLAALVPERYRAARERGDLFATANLAFYESFLLLTRDQPEEAIRCAEESLRPFRDEDFVSNQYGISYAVAQAALYRGDAAAAWARITREWEEWRRGGMLFAQCIRVEVRYLRGRAAVALLGAHTTSAAERRAAARALREDIRALSSDRCPPAAPLALALRAGAARVEGDERRVAQALHAAAEGFTRCGMTLHAAAAGSHLRRVGVAPSDDAAAARVFMEGEGVVNLDRLFHLVVQGFST